MTIGTTTGRMKRLMTTRETEESITLLLRLRPKIGISGALHGLLFFRTVNGLVSGRVRKYFSLAARAWLGLYSSFKVSTDARLGIGLNFGGPLKLGTGDSENESWDSTFLIGCNSISRWWTMRGGGWAGIVVHRFVVHSSRRCRI